MAYRRGTMLPVAVNWRGIRDVLRMRRTELDMSVKKLIADSGIGRTTIYRIENVNDIPDHIIDLDTLDALATAMGLTLSQVFARIEGLRSPHGEAVDSLPPQTRVGHDSDLSAAQQSAGALVQRELIAAFAEQLTIAVDRLVEARTQDRPDTAAKPARGRRPRAGR